MAFAPDGTLYVLYVNLQGSGNDPENLWLARSSDGGRTLDGPVRVAGRYTFGARLAVGRTGDVHAVWMRADTVGTLSIQGPNRIEAVRSTDGGATFSEPVTISDRGRERVGAASVVVDGEGDVIVLYEDFKDDRRDFENLEGPAWERPFALVLTRSTDRGGTFGSGVELESGVVATRRFLVYLPELPALAVGPGGQVYVAWTDGRRGDDDVLLRASGDGGETWSAPVRVNDNPLGDKTAQYLPAMSVSPEGRVDLVFLDRRRDPADVMTDAYVATSTDRGRSFVNARASSTSFDSTVGPSTASYLGVDLGSRLGISSVADQALAVWTDTRLGTPDTGRQDIASSVFSVTVPPAARSTDLPRVALLVAGALVAALVALVGVLRTRQARRGAGTGRSG